MLSDDFKSCYQLKLEHLIYDEWIDEPKYMYDAYFKTYDGAYTIAKLSQHILDDKSRILIIYGGMRKAIIYSSSEVIL